MGDTRRGKNQMMEKAQQSTGVDGFCIHRLKCLDIRKSLLEIQCQRTDTKPSVALSQIKFFFSLAFISLVLIMFFCARHFLLCMPPLFIHTSQLSRTTENIVIIKRKTRQGKKLNVKTPKYSILSWLRLLQLPLAHIDASSLDFQWRKYNERKYNKNSLFGLTSKSFGCSFYFILPLFLFSYSDYTLRLVLFRTTSSSTYHSRTNTLVATL